MTCFHPLAGGSGGQSAKSHSSSEGGPNAALVRGHRATDEGGVGVIPLSSVRLNSQWATGDALIRRAPFAMAASAGPGAANATVPALRLGPVIER